MAYSFILPPVDSIQFNSSTCRFFIYLSTICIISTQTYLHVMVHEGFRVSGHVSITLLFTDTT